jgi:hypothetical protein
MKQRVMKMCPNSKNTDVNECRNECDEQEANDERKKRKIFNEW